MGPIRIFAMKISIEYTKAYNISPLENCAGNMKFRLVTKSGKRRKLKKGVYNNNITKRNYIK